MTQWSIWGGFMKKTGGQKSRATVPLSKTDHLQNCVQEDSTDIPRG